MRVSCFSWNFWRSGRALSTFPHGAGSGHRDSPAWRVVPTHRVGTGIDPSPIALYTACIFLTCLVPEKTLDWARKVWGCKWFCCLRTSFPKGLVKKFRKVESRGLLRQQRNYRAVWRKEKARRAGIGQWGRITGMAGRASLPRYARAKARPLPQWFWWIWKDWASEPCSSVI